jgi:uncharacterized membrane protein YedE/YeeE
MADFTADMMSALAGGMMIGLAAVILMAGQGRVMGVSGIVSRLLPPLPADGRSETTWRALFVLGVLLAPLGYIALVGTPPEVTVASSPSLLILAGLLVGFGSVIGNGCTSGHGVCGLARLSPRSAVATLIFMTTAAVTVFVVRHGVGG